MATRILVADDEQPIADILTTILTDEGYDVVCVYDGAAALAAIEREPPALLISDIMMPRLSGIELARRVRAQEAGTHLPIILISAAPPPTVALPHTVVLTKPFDIEEVVALVARLLPTAARLSRQGQPLRPLDDAAYR